MFSFNNFFAGTYFCGSLEKSKKIVKIRTRNNFVPHGVSSLSELFSFVVDSLTLYLKEKSFSASEIFFNRVAVPLSCSQRATAQS